MLYKRLCLSTAGDRFESNAVDVITPVTEVAEEHLVLISRILEIWKLQNAKDL